MITLKNDSFPSYYSGRLNADQAAKILGVNPHDIPILTRAGILKPLGNPTRNATKWFHPSHVLEIAMCPKKMNKATNVIYQHWNNN